MAVTDYQTYFAEFAASALAKVDKAKVLDPEVAAADALVVTANTEATAKAAGVAKIEAEIADLKTRITNASTPDQIGALTDLLRVAIRALQIHRADAADAADLQSRATRDRTGVATRHAVVLAYAAQAQATSAAAAEHSTHVNELLTELGSAPAKGSVELAGKTLAAGSHFVKARDKLLGDVDRQDAAAAGVADDQPFGTRLLGQLWRRDQEVRERLAALDEDLADIAAKQGDLAPDPPTWALVAAERQWEQAIGELEMQATTLVDAVDRAVKQLEAAGNAADSIVPDPHRRRAVVVAAAEREAEFFAKARSWREKRRAFRRAVLGQLAATPDDPAGSDAVKAEREADKAAWDQLRDAQAALEQDRDIPVDGVPAERDNADGEVAVEPEPEPGVDDRPRERDDGVVPAEPVAALDPAAPVDPAAAGGAGDAAGDVGAPGPVPVDEATIRKATDRRLLNDFVAAIDPALRERMDTVFDAYRILAAARNVDVADRQNTIDAAADEVVTAHRAATAAALARARAVRCISRSSEDLAGYRAVLPNRWAALRWGEATLFTSMSRALRAPDEPVVAP